MTTRGRLAAVGAVALLLAGLTAETAVAAPQHQDERRPLGAFDPDQIGRLEQQAWEAYYYRDWPQVFLAMLDLLQGQFGLASADAAQAATLVVRAQIAFAERGAADGRAEAHLRDLYALVRDATGDRFDPARAAALEVRWWVVHRDRGRQPDPAALADALAELWSELYGLPPEAVRQAAAHRARAMDVSDRWVAEGRLPDSHLLGAVRGALTECYRALHAALLARPQMP